jgi:hypothetical protein
MTHQPHQPDSVDKEIARALTALRSAAPPAGMEDRILGNLDARLAQPQATSFLHSAFLRGAFTGAFAATAACAALFFALRTPHAAIPHTVAITHPASIAAPVALDTNHQCSSAPSLRDQPAPSQTASPIRTAQKADGAEEPSSRALRASRASRDEWEVKSSRSPHLIPASFAPSRPAPPAPLTAQERALAAFVRTATSTQLAALSAAAQQKADAEREAAFAKFFAPSPEILAADAAQNKALGITDDNESTAPASPAPANSTKEGQL